MAAQEQIDKAVGAIIEFNDNVLPSLKTFGERMEATEKQLEDITRMQCELNATRPVNVGEKIAGDAFREISKDYSDGENRKALRRIITSSTDDGMLKELHEINDTLMILQGLIPSWRPENSKYFKTTVQPFAEKSAFGKALIDSGSNVTQWRPEAWSGEIRTFYMQELRFTSVFPRMQMEAAIEQIPFADTGFRVDARPEPTQVPPPAADTSTPARNGFTLNTVELVGIMPYTRIFDEDTLRRYVPQLRNRVIPRGLAEAEEDMIINGDTANPHQDSNVTAGSNDRRAQRLGIRAEVIDESATYNTQETTIGTAAYEYDDFIETLVQHESGTGQSGLGSNPREGAWVFSNTAYLRAGKFDTLRANAQLVGTLQSSVASGAVNVIEGRPVFVSPFYPSDMDANGVVTAAGTLTGFSHVNFMQYVIGEFRGEEVITHTDNLAGVNYIIISTRKEFLKLLTSGNISAVSGINV